MQRLHGPGALRLVKENFGMASFDPGLADVVAAETRLSHVDGAAGELIIGGYRLEQLAAEATYEEVAYLLWHGRLPTAEELARFQEAAAHYRALPPLTGEVLRQAAENRSAPIDALRMAAATFDLGLEAADGLARANGNNGNLAENGAAPAILARMASAVATYGRLQVGLSPVAPDANLGHAANLLYMLEGVAPEPKRARALEIYLITVSEHGLNASTFAARVIAATGSDLVSAITGALGALKGPLHGGAPGPALDMVFEIGEASRAEEVLRAKLAQGERLMGFGHRVYKVRDPRADVLAAAAEQLLAHGEGKALYDLAKAVEATALRVLAEVKPGRKLDTNVEYFTALLLHGLGLNTDMFTPVFAAGRTVGWIAHCYEQAATGRIIRPQARYVGEVLDAWTPRAAR
jgi:citrate synthase